ncbi:MAG: CPBP family intramembrane metalloprotease, partial [Planctomycetales bacterium]
DFSTPSLAKTDRDLLKNELGWFGKLALLADSGIPTPERQALIEEGQGLVAKIGGGVFCVLGLAFLGFFFLTFVVVGFLLGRFHPHLIDKSARANGQGGVYAEAFAVWMMLFLGLSVGLGAVGSIIDLSGWEMGASGGVFLLSLSATAWPVLRGVPWRQVREDIGWTARGSQEWSWGLIGYAMALPLMFLGLLVMLELMAIFGQVPETAGGKAAFESVPIPAHPIARMFVDSGWREFLLIFVTAAVIAPIVEETMFRGFLYRHLRESSNRFGPAASILGSAVFSSLVFAAIHPQGLMAVPVLAALASGFCLIREIRGSLVPCMVAHGVHNGLLILGMSVLI